MTYVWLNCAACDGRIGVYPDEAYPQESPVVFCSPACYGRGPKPTP